MLSIQSLFIHPFCSCNTGYPVEDSLHQLTDRSTFNISGPRFRERKGLLPDRSPCHVLEGELKTSHTEEKGS